MGMTTEQEYADDIIAALTRNAHKPRWYRSSKNGTVCYTAKLADCTFTLCANVANIRSWTLEIYNAVDAIILTTDVPVNTWHAIQEAHRKQMDDVYSEIINALDAKE